MEVQCSVFIKQSSPPMIALRLPASHTVLASSYAPPCPVNLLSSTLSSSLPPPPHYPCTLILPSSPPPSSPFPSPPPSPLLPPPPLPISLAPSFSPHPSPSSSPFTLHPHPSPSPFPTEATIMTDGTTRRRRCGSREPRGSSPASRPPTMRKAPTTSLTWCSGGRHSRNCSLSTTAWRRSLNSLPPWECTTLPLWEHPLRQLCRRVQCHTHIMHCIIL